MGQFFHNTFVFLFIYWVNTAIVFTTILRAFNPNPKLLYVKSKGIYNFAAFPNNILFCGRNIKKKKKDRHLTLAELTFYLLNQATLIGAIVLQLLPSMPCEVLKIEFGSYRYRGWNVTVDTYNQKIPLCLIFALLCAEMLFLFGDVLVRLLRDRAIRKKAEVGLIIGITAICLLFLLLLIRSIYLLF